MEPSLASARDWLEQHGYSVEQIPTTPEKRADLRAFRQGECCLIEAKGRSSHQGWQQLLAASASDGLADLSRKIEPWNGISSMLTEAGEQLAATPSNNGTLKLIWIDAAGDDELFVVDCVASRLVGEAGLLVVETGREPYEMQCFYYHQTDFRRMPWVDGALLRSTKGVRLYANSFGRSKASFRESIICSIFRQGGALCDAEILEQEGLAYMLGEDFNGTCSRDKWAYVCNRYGKLTVEVPEYQSNAALSVPRSCFE